MKLHIALVGPGIMPIPPFGWGAVETVVWSQARELQKIGFRVTVINESSRSSILKLLYKINPDLAIFHYDELIDIAIQYSGKKAIVSHYGYLDQVEKHLNYSKIFAKYVSSKIPIFCLSNSILNTYLAFGVNKSHLHLVPNGVDLMRYRFVSNPDYENRAIYLAKIDYRKRQFLYQDIDFLDFAGNISEKRFKNHRNYLGEWSRVDVHNNLTNYSTLVLLSDGEAHPLVVPEALAAGCGLVLSQFANANLSPELPFVDIITEDKINDLNYVSSIIKENMVKAITHRSLIRKYAEEFDWKLITQKYLVKAILEVI